MLDLASRARSGLFVHIPLWFLLGWSNRLISDLPLFFWVNMAIFCSISLLRLRFQDRIAARAADDPWAWRLFLAMILWNALHWGLLGALAVGWPPLQPARTSIMFLVTGVAAAGGMGLAMQTIVRVAYPIAAVAPALCVILFHSEKQYLSMGCALLVFMIYIIRASRTVQDDYRAAADARTELEKRAQQLERLSITDALTQVHNRQFLDRQLGIEWARAERNLNVLSLLMIDIDHFKQVNDGHGHPFGDACLQAVANALQGALQRPGDMLARYGGEEFAVLLPGIDSAGAAVVAQRLHAAVAGIHIEHDGRAVHLTCSIGVHSVTSMAACTAAQMISRADQALYAAKRQGRNRVVVSELAPA